jgi:hypothetical protein
MTIARNSGDERADKGAWPWSHRKTFLERPASQSYAAAMIREYRTMAGRFCDAIEKRGLRIGDLDGATTERLRHSVPSGVTGSALSYAKFCARRFIEHLTEAGPATASQPPTKKLTPLERLRDEYQGYLCKQRGLAESTIYPCTRFMDWFMAFRFPGPCSGRIRRRLSVSRNLFREHRPLGPSGPGDRCGQLTKNKCTNSQLPRRLPS